MPNLSRRRVLRTIGGGTTIGLAGVAGCLGDDTVVETQEVEITNDAFDPKNIKVDRQQTVYWENVTDTRYVLESATSTWNFRQLVDPEMSTGYTFDSSGIYRLVAREGEEDTETPETPTETPTGTPEFTGMRMKIAVGRDVDDPVTE